MATRGSELRQALQKPECLLVPYSSEADLLGFLEAQFHPGAGPGIEDEAD